MYKLPNNNHIDVEGGVDAVLDGDSSNLYFLDVEKGEIGCFSTSSGSVEALDRIRKQKNRYFEIPRSTRLHKEQWLRDFAVEIIPFDDASLSKKILSLPKENFFENALAKIKGAENSLIDGWDQWSRDHAYEIFDGWLGVLPLDITKEWDGCADCAICKATAEGKDSLPELLKAFSEEEFVGRMEEIIQPEKTKKVACNETGNRSTGKTKKQKNEIQPCGLCGKKNKTCMQTECCGNWICGNPSDYVLFSYSRDICCRNHDRFTLCGYHHTEKHPGDWKKCKKCRNSFETEMYVWYGTNEYNFEVLTNPPKFQSTHCYSCGVLLSLPEGGFTSFGSKYGCESCMAKGFDLRK